MNRGNNGVSQSSERNSQLPARGIVPGGKDEMEEFKKADFLKDLEELTVKYGITSAAFTGNAGGTYIGMVIGKMTVTAFWETALNVGRLWQHMREQTRKFLDEFDGWGKS